MKKVINLLFAESHSTIFQICWLLFRLHVGLSIAIGAGFAKIAMPEWFTQQVGEIGFTFPSPFFWAWLAVWGEFIGGLLLAFGLFTRLAAFQLTFQFFVISFIWYDEPEPIVGMYYQQLFFWAFVLITVIGGSKFSLDTIIKKRFSLNTAKPVFTFILLFLLFHNGFAQSKRLDGNRQIMTSVRTLGEFHAINIKDYCNVEIICGQMPKVEITIDENLLPYLKTTVRKGTLHIEAEGWIEATQILVKIGTPFIKKLTNDAWGTVAVNNLDTKVFELNAAVGTIILVGKTEELIINAGSGKIDATQLNAKTAHVKHTSHASTKVFASEKLIANLDDGDLFYLGNPTQIEKIISENATLQDLEKPESASDLPSKYIKVIIINNSARKESFEIKGPRGNRFSYGFALGSFGTRAEKVPIGTRILNNNGKTLVTITADDEGKKVKLF